MYAKIQNSTNNAILKAVKSRMNARVYKQFRTEMHFTGIEGGMAYLSQFFNAKSWPQVRAEIEGSKLS